MNACFCSGPRPGHTLCPCRERNETDKDRRLRLLEAEVADLRRSVRHHDMMNMRMR